MNDTLAITNPLGRRFLALMLLASALAIGAALWAAASSQKSRPASVPSTAAVAASQPAGRTGFRIGRIVAPAIPESSGVIASRRYPGVFWTHNDSGNPAEIFAIKRDGTLLRTCRVAAENNDWEDIALDDAGRLLIADIGNNDHRRKEVFVYAVTEPDPAAGGNDPLKVEQTWKLTFPGKPFDSESLFVHGKTAYVVSKLRTLEKAGLYSFELDPARPNQELKSLGELPVRFPATAADVSQDGKWLVILTVGGPYLFRIDGDPATALKGKPRQVFYTDKTMEAATFVTEGILATTEDRDLLLYQWKHFGLKDGQ